MPRSSHMLAAVVAGAGLAGAAFATASASSGEVALTPVFAAQDRVEGTVRANVLSRELTEVPIAQGAMTLDGGTTDVPFYGYDGDGPMVPAFGSAAEASKTEPDKNTYLKLSGLDGADPSYDYGRHFVFQGHEGGAPGYITRINLDADDAHRVTLLATHDTDGKPLPDFDGSTWDPWARRLLFTAENGADGGVWQATPDFPSAAQNLSSVFGKAGYEGVQNDNRGNVYLAEDAGGKNGSAAADIPDARQPNSFLFRLLPRDRTDLSRGGQLQALQVLDQAGRPIVFGGSSQDAIDADIQSPQNHALRTYANRFDTRWIDVTPDPTTLDANAAAKAAGATPFKRPENLQFRPGAHFKELFFDETGDTTLLSDAEAAKDPGGYGSIFRLRQSPRSNRGSLSLFYAGDPAHAAFDNVAFLSAHRVSFVEDRGDDFHAATHLDSGWVLDTREDYGAPSAKPPVRWLAEGRDASATIDAGLSEQPDFKNDGDNEITGIHVSDGDPGRRGILGARVPTLFRHGWRWFWTQQHGDNITWEVLPAARR